MIRRLESRDIERVVAIHLASFPGFFLSFLGPRFLALYYGNVCASSDGIAVVYEDPGGIPSGFVVGSTNPRAFYSNLLRRNWLKFSIASLDAIGKKPAVALRLFRAIFHPSQNPTGDEIAGLYSIGISPEAQGTGAGKKLVHAFLREARERGCRRVFLTTDRDGNSAVNSFYRNLGFHVEREFKTPENRWMNEYWIDLAPDPGSRSVDA